MFDSELQWFCFCFLVVRTAYTSQWIAQMTECLVGFIPALDGFVTAGRYGQALAVHALKFASSTAS